MLKWAPLCDVLPVEIYSLAAYFLLSPRLCEIFRIEHNEAVLVKSGLKINQSDSSCHVSVKCLISFPGQEREGEKKNQLCLFNCYSEGKTITCFK